MKRQSSVQEGNHSKRLKSLREVAKTYPDLQMNVAKEVTDQRRQEVRRQQFETCVALLHEYKAAWETVPGNRSWTFPLSPELQQSCPSKALALTDKILKTAQHAFREYKYAWKTTLSSHLWSPQIPVFPVTQHSLNILRFKLQLPHALTKLVVSYLRLSYVYSYQIPVRVCLYTGEAMWDPLNDPITMIA